MLVGDDRQGVPGLDVLLVHPVGLLVDDAVAALHDLVDDRAGHRDGAGDDHVGVDVQRQDGGHEGIQPFLGQLFAVAPLVRLDVVEDDQVGALAADLEAEVAAVHAGGCEHEPALGVIEAHPVGLDLAASPGLGCAELWEVLAQQRVAV